MLLPRRHRGSGPKVARMVAVKSVAQSEDDALRTMLLADIRTTFAELDTDRLLSDQIVDALKEMENRPWADYRRGQRINKKSHCVSKRPIWLGEAVQPCAALPPTIQRISPAARARSSTRRMEPRHDGLEHQQPVRFPACKSLRRSCSGCTHWLP
jgi:hypothetical protein